MRKLLVVFCCSALLGACNSEDALDVVNRNNPDAERALGRPAELEALIGSSYNVVHKGTLGQTNDALQPQMQVMGLENSSALANFGMGARFAIPREAITNSRGNNTATGNFFDFRLNAQAAQSAATALRRLNEGVNLGTPSQNRRARAFAFFVMGVANGNIALAYDSGAYVTQLSDPSDVPLFGYAELMPRALEQLDSAIAHASASDASGAGGFPLPNTWIRGNSMNAADFIRFVRSYKARLRAQVARSASERAGVNWAAVIADATAGITATINIDAAPAQGWDVVWPIQHHVFLNWHQMTPHIIGMADSSGGYDAWLATPLGSRSGFLIRTADKRFPEGNTRAQQNASSGGGTVSAEPPRRNLYFKNRISGNDAPSEPYGTSNYDFFRYQKFYNDFRNGPYPIMTKAEIDMYAAEGYIRTGNPAAAAALINRTRVANGELPPVTAAGPPPGPSCVPRVPNSAANFTSTKCGDLMEAMKWESRMESAYSGYGMWYFNGRGWGDLPEGTAVHWPVPYQEMDARGQPFYDLGGVGRPGGAPKGTYGF